MKLARILSLGIAVGFAQCALATLPLDRPTPPPCCVDGICHAHAARFGYFPTRWRVWPGLAVAPMPTPPTTTPRNIPGINPYDPIRPEDEDRQAPEPTRTSLPAAEQPQGEQPTNGAPPTGPRDSRGGAGAPPTAPLGTPPGGLTLPPGGLPTTPGPLQLQPTMPGGPAPRPSTTPLAPPPTGTSPLGPPLGAPPLGTPPLGGEPSAQIDQPPAPPFAMNRGRAAAAVPAGGPAATGMRMLRPVGDVSGAAGRRASQAAANATANDPAPAPPLALGGTL
jgi:hypothetical protein